MGTLSDNDFFPTYVNLQAFCDEEDILQTTDEFSQLYLSDGEEGILDNEATDEKLPKVLFRKPNRQVGTAYYDYTAKQNDEISLKRGSMVEIISESCGEEGWVKAKVNNQKGMVPKNYVTLVGDQPTFVDPAYIKEGDVIGEGGFSQVRRGCYKNSPVALKIPRRKSPDVISAIQETLEREALALCRLDHDNIVGFIGMSLKPMLLVLELCEGGTLFSLCRQMKVAYMPTSIKWAKQVASAMNYLHSREDPLVHADLKADNVLVKELPCKCGVVESNWRFSLHQYDINGICRNCSRYRLDYLTMKITDFGLSRSSKSRRDSSSGSLPWLAPEVITRRQVCSTSSDIWSYGVFMWEIFSCKIPFSHIPNSLNLILTIGSGKRTLKLPEDCPEVLRSIFRACWTNEPLHRPNFRQIIEMLDKLTTVIDPDFRWNTDDDDSCGVKSRSEEAFFDDNDTCGSRPPWVEKLSYDEMERRFRKLNTISPARHQFRNAFNCVGAPGPAVKPRKNNKQRFRVEKVEISQPSAFRHHLSVRSAAEDLTPGSSMFVLKYDDNIEELDEQSATSDIDDNVKAKKVKKKNNDIVKSNNRDVAAENCCEIKPFCGSGFASSVFNVGYTRLPALTNVEQSTPADNFVLVEFSGQGKGSKIGTYEKKTAKMLNYRRNNYVRLQNNTVSSRKPCVLPLYGNKTGNTHVATIADTKSKSKSNPDLLHYKISTDESNSKIEELNASKTANVKKASPRVNRNKDYVTLEKVRVRCQSVGDKLQEAHANDIGLTENDKFYHEPSAYDALCVQDLSSQTQLENLCNIPAESETSSLESFKVRSLERANAFRRKIISSTEDNSFTKIQNLLEPSVMFHNEVLINEPSTSAMVVTPATPPDKEYFNNEPKESSTSLPINMSALQSKLLTPTSGFKSSTFLYDAEKDNRNLDLTPSDVSLLLSGSPTSPDSHSRARSCSPFPTKYHIKETSTSPIITSAKLPSPLNVRRRKTSSTNSQNVFYVHDFYETCLPETSTNPSCTTPRRRSANHKLGNILSKMTNMFGNRLTSATSDSGENDCLSDGVNECISENDSINAKKETNIESIICYHPHHNYSNLKHNCALNKSLSTSNNVCLLARTNDIERCHFQRTLRTRNSFTSNQRTFTKYNNYPERQRHRSRLRTEPVTDAPTNLMSGSSHRQCQSAILSVSSCEQRSFPPSMNTANWRSGYHVNNNSQSRSTAATPSPTATQPRISFNTVIELQSPNKIQENSQFRPHICGGNTVASSSHRRNDILSRPIESFNDLRQKQIAKSPTSSSRQYPLPIHLNTCSNNPSSSYDLFLSADTLNSVHQRSKSSENSSSIIGCSNSCKPTSPPLSCNYGYHSLQRQKNQQRPAMLDHDDSMINLFQPSHPSQNFQIERATPRTPTLSNHTYITMEQPSSDTYPRQENELPDSKIKQHVPFLANTNDCYRHIFTTKFDCNSPTAQVKFLDKQARRSKQKSLTNVEQFAERNSENEAIAPPIPLKKNCFKPLNSELIFTGAPSNILSAETSQLNCDDIHPTLFCSASEKNSSTEVRQQRPNTLNLSSVRSAVNASKSNTKLNRQAKWIKRKQETLIINQ